MGLLVPGWAQNQDLLDFHLRIGVKVDFAFLGNLGAPGTRKTLSCLITIEMPWFLPDINIRIS
jgi:hypothetical protein